MMRPTMGGMSGRARKHGICRAMIPLPVAVSLSVTCFFFGLFYGRMPVNTVTNSPVDMAPLDASLQQQPQQQDSLRQQQHIQHHRKQQEHLDPTRKQPEPAEQQPAQQPHQQQEVEHQQQQYSARNGKLTVACPPEEPCPPQQPAAPKLQPGQSHSAGQELQHAGQQQQQQQQQEEHQHAPPPPQQQQQAGKQQTAAAPPDQVQQSPAAGVQRQPTAQQAQPQQQQVPFDAQQQKQRQQQEQQQQTNQAQQQQQQHDQPKQQPTGGPVMTDVDQRIQTCLQQSGLLQPLLTPTESGNRHYTTATYQILSWYPRLVLFPNFIDQARAQHIIGLAAARLQRSDVKLRHGESYTGKATRTSSGVFIRREDDPDGVLGWLEDKIAAVTLLPSSHGEAFYVLRYQQHDKYDSHMDVFDPAEYGQQKTLRMATMIVYLSAVEAGGETVFKREGKDGDQRKVADAAACDTHDFKYKPRFGDAVLFYSLNPDNSIDQRSLHGGCPVQKGTKWVITKWMHNKPVQTGGFGWA